VKIATLLSKRWVFSRVGGSPYPARGVARTKDAMLILRRSEESGLPVGWDNRLWSKAQREVGLRGSKDVMF